MNVILVGRELESSLLNKYINSDRSELVAVYGRRRVGKTFFIRQVLKGKACFTFSGAENATIKQQLMNFGVEYSVRTGSNTLPANWTEAFVMLRNYLQSSRLKRKIIFIDELPWLDGAKSGFLSAFEYFWNAWASARTDIKLIVCGSATSWMINNLINNRGGLHNRVTHQIYIAPFTLGEAEKYFKTYKFGYRRAEIAECYMVMGGVPFYYSMLDRELSAAQNIDRLFFGEKAELRYEFDNLFRSLYKRSDSHIAVVKALATKRMGLTRKEILEITKLNNNSKFTEVLDELEKCGFIRQYQPFSEAKRDIMYQIIDHFVLFHFSFLKNLRKPENDFWARTINTKNYEIWAGLSFEMLCISHIKAIKQALGIPAVRTRECGFIFKGDDCYSGAQIDLLIDRDDNTINICEMKYTNSEYPISAKYAKELQNKIDAFIHCTNTSKSIMLTMITSQGVKKNPYSTIVQKALNLDSLFFLVFN